MKTEVLLSLEAQHSEIGEAYANALNRVDEHTDRLAKEFDERWMYAEDGMRLAPKRVRDVAIW